MGILRSKFNISRGDEAEAETPSADAPSVDGQSVDGQKEETSRKPPTTSPQKAAKGKRRRNRGPKGLMTLADLAAPTDEILREDTPETAAEAEAVPSEAQLSALAQVRDLIAGPQLSDYANRITELEAAAREQAALTAQLRDAILALQARCTALAERDEAETQARGTLEEVLSSRLAALDEELATTRERLRDEAAAQGTALTGLVQQQSKELDDKVQAGLHQLEVDKTSRAALAAVLVAAARSLHSTIDDVSSG